MSVLNWRGVERSAWGIEKLGAVVELFTSSSLSSKPSCLAPYAFRCDDDERRKCLMKLTAPLVI